MSCSHIVTDEFAQKYCRLVWYTAFWFDMSVYFVIHTYEK